MSMENEALEAFMAEKKEREWLESNSGRIYRRLQEIAARDGAQLSVEGKGQTVEIFKYGDEVARLVKHFEDATVGVEGGNVALYAEAWEYKRRPWWREALDAEMLPTKFLDTPVVRMAQDAGIERAKEIFWPPAAVEAFQLASAEDVEKREAAEEWVTREIIQRLSPLVKPDYEIKFHDYHLRFIPKTPEAHRSRVEDNETYERIFEGLKEIAPQLEEAYRQKTIKSGL